MAACKSCSAEWLISGTLRFLSSLQRNFVGRRAGAASLKPAVALLRPKSRGCCFPGDFGSCAEVLHSSEPRWFSPSERGRNVLLETEEPPYFLLLQLASFCWPTRSCFAFSSSFCSWPQSPAQPHFFLLLFLPARFCSFIIIRILAPLSVAP